MFRIGAGSATDNLRDASLPRRLGRSGGDIASWSAADFVRKPRRRFSVSAGHFPEANDVYFVHM
jgi:hypothetical protein